jgi:hypothetical protein
MKSVITALALCLGLLAHPAHADAADDAKTVADITAQLQDFLEHVDQRDTHDRFWAADLVYTTSGGEVTDKAKILAGFDAPPAAADDVQDAAAKDADAAKAEADADAAAAKEFYSAEDILVRPFGDTAALTFRLVHHGADGKLSYYRNSGMLARRDGRWQVVTWQATKVPEPAAK